MPGRKARRGWGEGDTVRVRFCLSPAGFPRVKANLEASSRVSATSQKIGVLGGGDFGPVSNIKRAGAPISKFTPMPQGSARERGDTSSPFTRCVPEVYFTDSRLQPPIAPPCCRILKVTKRGHRQTRRALAG